MFLPDEIINLILSYREINPTAKLIKDAIEESENLSKICDINKFDCFKCFYLKHLISLKCIKYYNMRVKIQDKWEKTIDNISDEEIKVEYEIYKDERKSECFLYSSYLYDFRHSFKCCNMINDKYFHSKDLYKKLFDNKYRTEIFNGNKIMTKRKTDFPLEYTHYVNPSYWCESIVKVRIDEVNCNFRY
jgi:hypothetical protein